MTILTSIWGAQHPNAGQNIQQPVNPKALYKFITIQILKFQEIIQHVIKTKRTMWKEPCGKKAQIILVRKQFEQNQKY